MSPELYNKFKELEDVRRHIKFHVSSWDEERFNRKPAKGKWSAGQVIFHLMQVEQFSINYVNKKLSYPEKLKNTGLVASFRFYLLKFFLRLPVKYKAPSRVATVPDNLSKEELLKQWDDVRKEMTKFLNSFPEELHNKNIFKHLVAGRLNVSQMLEFIHDHINHHLPQIYSSNTGLLPINKFL